jgi:hypothetical protein
MVVGIRMKMTKLRTWNLMACLALGLLPGAASATIFSFGTVAATDVITSLNFTTGTNKVTYDPGTNVMHVEAYLTTINFSNRPSITGIATDTVLFTSDIMLVGGSFGVTEPTANNPRSMVSGFMNGALQDLSIFDTGSGFTLLDADYIGNLSFTASETGSVTTPLTVNGQLTGSLAILPTSNADFMSAFGSLGQLNAVYASFFSDGAPVGSNLCNLVKSGVGTYGSQVCGPGYALDDFAVNTTMTVNPVVIPEPGTALLLGLGLAGVAALRRK